MTRILITLPLVDERACTRCTLRQGWDLDRCHAFRTKDGYPRKLIGTVFVKGVGAQFKRLPECIAAEKEVERG